MRVLSSALLVLGMLMTGVFGQSETSGSLSGLPSGLPSCAVFPPLGSD
jgi:hypothetical protein